VGCGLDSKMRMKIIELEMTIKWLDTNKKGDIFLEFKGKEKNIIDKRCKLEKLFKKIEDIYH